MQERNPMSDVKSNLEQRASRAAESILENESLTDELDDVAAKALLDWGLACTKIIVQSTAGLDDLQADEAISVGLRAIHRLMRLVNKWVANRQEMDTESRLKRLNGVIEQASAIYGVNFSAPGSGRCLVFVHRIKRVDDPVQMIANLREFVETSNI
jgi:hypothetical protein